MKNGTLTAFFVCYFQTGKVRHDEFLTFIKGGASLDLNAVQPKPNKWILDLTWLNLVELSNLHQFSGILDQVSPGMARWSVACPPLQRLDITWLHQSLQWHVR